VRSEASASRVPPGSTAIFPETSMGGSARDSTVLKSLAALDAG
jgi:hypothetical protein